MIYESNDMFDSAGPSCSCKAGYVGNGTLCVGAIYQALCTLPQTYDFCQVIHTFTVKCESSLYLYFILLIVSTVERTQCLMLLNRDVIVETKITIRRSSKTQSIVMY